MIHRLLLADDSITIQKVVQLVLAGENFEVRAVSDGDAALEIINDFMPDIVLADIEMPKLNGYQLCDRIKKNSITSMIPVILLAGAFEPIDQVLSAEVKADEIIIKPFEADELINKLNAAIYGASSGNIPVSADIEENLRLVDETPVTTEKAVSETEISETGIDLTVKMKEEAIAGLSGAPEFENNSEPEIAKEAFMPPQIDMPSRDEIILMLENMVNAKVTDLFSSIDIKEMIIVSLMPAVRDSADKILRDMAPELTEKILKEILHDLRTSITSEVERILWKTLQNLTASMVSKEHGNI